MPSYLLDPDTLQRALDGLTDEEWGALAAIFLGHETGITVELAHQIVGLFSGRRRRSAGPVIERLKALSLVETILRQYRHILAVPAPLRASLREPLFRRLWPGEVAAAAMPTPLQTVTSFLTEDQARLLALISRGELLLTQQGQLQKRTLRHVLSHLGLAGSEEEAAERYPEPLGLLLAFAFDQGLAIRAGGAVLAGPHLQAWLDSPACNQREDLFRFWQSRYQASDVEAALHLLLLQPGTWWPLDTLARQIQPLINPVNRASLRMRLEHHMRSFLLPLGHVMLYRHEDRDWVAATLQSDAQQSEQPLFVQADYEIIAPRPLPARLLWQLELMADLVHLDQGIQRYHLSSTSFYRALGLGLGADAALATLRQQASRGLPQNVLFDLQDWARHFGKISFASLCVIRCATPEMADQIQAARKVRPFIVERIGPTALVVRRREYEQILDALQQEGYLPRPGIAEDGEGGG